MELWFVIPSELYTATHEGLSPDLVSKDNQGENDHSCTESSMSGAGPLLGQDVGRVGNRVLSCFGLGTDRVSEG